MLTITITKKDGTYETFNVGSNRVTYVEGGIKVLHTTKGLIHTFYPYHRIWEIETYIPTKDKS